MNYSIDFAPFLNPIILLVIALFAALSCLFLFKQNKVGTSLRFIAFALLLLALLNPRFIASETEDLTGIVFVVTDESLSQKATGRDQISNEIAKLIEERTAQFKEFEVQKVVVRNSYNEQGTQLFSQLEQAISEVAQERIAGAIIISDGQIHDVPEQAERIGFNAPLHVLLTGQKNDVDRRIVINKAPKFGLVGTDQTITIELADIGRRSNDRVPVTIRVDGEEIATRVVTLGQEIEVTVPIRHTGDNIVEFDVDELEGELTTANNVGITTVKGIRENLRVLLVSGEPHAGERAWRNLLKSDAAVDLVHFTILRPPEKQDGTPINELSLIAFPTRELFQEKIEDFDLIIFDRYTRRGVLPIIYFDNITRYVRDGGAVLVAAGPNFATSSSIFRSPLSPILPAEPTGQTLEKAFHPQVTNDGQKHPVTRGLPGSDKSPPDWGRWFRTIEVAPQRGEVLMTGADDRPLLLLSREEQGRVAILMSDHVWLWSRGFEGGGPQVPLMRRLAHWLMQEPDLEEEHLSASSNGDTLKITRQTMLNEAPDTTIIAPDGSEMTVELSEESPGVWSAEIETEQSGLYRLSDDATSAMHNVGVPDPLEMSEVIATDAVLSPIAKELGGGVFWAVGAENQLSLPSIVSMRASNSYNGNNWMGLRRTDAKILKGLTSTSLMSGLVALALLLMLLSATWYREGR